jgi:hypothetical protein
MEADMDEDVSGGYSGTFRWKQSKRLPSLPPARSCPGGGGGSGSGGSGGGGSILADDPEHLKEAMGGWMQYFITRCETVAQCNALVAAAKEDMSLIDCLSAPVSVGAALAELGVFPLLSGGKLQVGHCYCYCYYY